MPKILPIGIAVPLEMFDALIDLLGLLDLYLLNEVRISEDPEMKAAAMRTHQAVQNILVEMCTVCERPAMQVNDDFLPAPKDMQKGQSS